MLSPGTVFAGRYEILRTISAGGMGTVYEALHRETRRKRALKVMLPNMLKDADLRRRFALEAQVTADVDSDHIVETFDAGVDEASGSPFLVMELLRGEDLGARLMRLVRLPPQEVVGLLNQAADALDKTHAAGIVHRDLKPENLFAVARDGTLRLKLLDFGIAKVMRETEVGKATRSMGTPLYMAPEQFEGEPRLGPRVDLYALAQIGYTLLVGEPYWTEEARELASALALMKRVANGATESAVTRASRLGVVLPAAFDGWFSRATSVEPDDRFSSAAETVSALAEAVGVRAALGEPVVGTVPVVEEPGRGMTTPAGSTPKAGIGNETTLAEPERDTPGGTGGTRPRLTLTREGSKVGIPVIAALAALSIGTTYLLLRTHEVAPADPSGAASAPSAPTTSAASAAPPPPPVAASGPAIAPLEATAPTATSASPVTSAAPAAPSASGTPRARPPVPRPSAPAVPATAAPPPPPTAAPAEPWRTR